MLYLISLFYIAHDVFAAYAIILSSVQLLVTKNSFFNPASS